MPVHRHPIAASQAMDPLSKIPLDHALIERLRDSYRHVRENGLQLAEIFYAKLFAAAPHLRSMFRTDPQVQSRKLINSLDMIVNNLVSPEDNAAMLAALGKRHAEYGAKPEHYDLVIELLVESMAELLGSRADAQRLNEWRIALRLVSNQMIAASGSTHPSPGSPGTADSPNER